MTDIKQFIDLIKAAKLLPKDDRLFSHIISVAWNEFLIRKLCGMGGNTIERWMNNLSTPHSLLRPHIYNAILQELDQIQNNKPSILNDSEPIDSSTSNYEHYLAYYKIQPTDMFKTLVTDWRKRSLIYFDHEHKRAFVLADSIKSGNILFQQVQEFFESYKKRNECEYEI